MEVLLRCTSRREGGVATFAFNERFYLTLPSSIFASDSVKAKLAFFRSKRKATSRSKSVNGKVYCARGRVLDDAKGLLTFGGMLVEVPMKESGWRANDKVFMRVEHSCPS